MATSEMIGVVVNYNTNTSKWHVKVKFGFKLSASFSAHQRGQFRRTDIFEPFLHIVVGVKLLAAVFVTLLPYRNILSNAKDSPRPNVGKKVPKCPFAGTDPVELELTPLN